MRRERELEDTKLADLLYHKVVFTLLSPHFNPI